MVTPILRPLVKHLEWNSFKFLIALWLIGNFLVPFVNQFAPFAYNPVMFVFTGWVGYFLLGSFLLKVKVRSWITVLGVVLGVLGTIFGAFWITITVGENFVGYFHEPLNSTIILASTALFLLLIAIPQSKVQSRHENINRLLHWIGQNTLPIYLIHIMVMETLQKGYLGFALNMEMMNPIIEIPLLTLVTFSLSAVIVYPLKKIPYVKKILG